MTITKRQLRRIIKEEKARILREASVTTAYSGKVEVEWDKAHARYHSAIPSVVEVDPQVVAEYSAEGDRVGEFMAEKIITNWLWDEFEAKPLGWNWMRSDVFSAPSGNVEVEWDFEMDDDSAWNALSYEEQEAQADLPPVIKIDPGVMADYLADVAEYGEEQADDMITNWLSDEFGWLHHGWSWV